MPDGGSLMSTRQPFGFSSAGLFLMIWGAFAGAGVGMIQTEAGQNAALADQLYKEGFALEKKGDHAGALVKYEAGLDLAEKAGSKKIMAAICVGIGSAKKMQGDY